MVCTSLAKALSFHTVTVEDKARYDALSAVEPSQSADRSFANLYFWNELYHQQIAFFEDRAILRFGRDGQWQYLCPFGGGALNRALGVLLETEPTLTLSAVTEQELSAVLQDFPDTFEVFENRDIADYLYSAESLATLSGKKLHAKRNHVNAFSAANVWSVKPLEPTDFDSCRHIAASWAAQRGGDGPSRERAAMERAFSAYAALDLHGALLIANGMPVAFTVGSFLTPDTLCVHFEKALPDVQGAFPTINREFVRMMLERFPALTTVNREDDMGLENLRTAKLSYRPIALLRKYTLTRKNASCREGTFVLQ